MATWNRRLPWIVAAVVVLAGAGWWLLRARGQAPRFVTVAVDRGDVVEVVGATGALEAVTTVQIGSQVSGTIKALGADFNSQVKKGQVIARLDPSLFEARLGQARANLLAARANVERARSSVDDTRLKFSARARSGPSSWRPRATSTAPRRPTTGPWPSCGPTRPRSASPRPASTRRRSTSSTPSSARPSTAW